MDTGQISENENMSMMNKLPEDLAMLSSFPSTSNTMIPHEKAPHHQGDEESDFTDDDEESFDEDDDEMPPLEGAVPVSSAATTTRKKTATITKASEDTNKKAASKKRKPRDPNKRRKIRKLLTMEELSAHTIQAVKEEEERRKMLLQQAKKAKEQQQQMEMAKIKKEQQQQSSSTTSFFSAPCLTSLLTATDSKKNNNKQAKNSPLTSSNVICISSDEDDVIPSTSLKKKSADELISISSDSSDDVTILSSQDNSNAANEDDDDMNNSGLHVNDERNVPDEQGQVMVNINHPPDEDDIYLAPQIAAIIRPHQIGGIRFMYDNIILTRQQFETTDGLGCILAHSMGLGKTLQVIGFVQVFLHHTKAKTALCVVPVNTLMNWVAEFDKWLPPASKMSEEQREQGYLPRQFNVHVLRDVHKTIDSRAKVVTTWKEEGGVLLLGYEMFRLLTTTRNTRPRKPKKKSKKQQQDNNNIIDVDEEDRKSSLHKRVRDTLLDPGPDMIICDEGHRIKNNGARTSEKLKEIKTKRRVVLTGYPMQNNLVEYWCMVDFVRPDYLGTKREFYNLFERPITNGQGTDSTREDRRLMRCRSDVLHNLLKGFVQRRSHSVLCHTLPEKKEYVLMVRFSKIQKRLYNTYMKLRASSSTSAIAATAYNGETPLPSMTSSTSWTSSINPIRAFSVCCRIWNHPDVLYRTFMQQSDQFDLDMDLDYAIVDGNKSSKSKRDKKNKKRKVASGDEGDDESSMTSSPMEGRGGASTPSSSLAAPGSVMTSLTSAVVAPVSSVAADDKDKTDNYDWVGNILDGYRTGDMEISGKLVILMHLLDESVRIGDKILVFSQSLSTLTLIEDFLSKKRIPDNHLQKGTETRQWIKGRSYLRLDGNTGSSEREKLINQFNDPDNTETWLFLLSTKAGCLGINLIGANRVVVLDASWNPCYDAQAVCRCYRYGQQKKSFIYRLVADQSMEKKIYERQVSKQGMSDRVVDKLNPALQFTKREVVSLLEFSDKDLPAIPTQQLVDKVDDPVLHSLCQKHGEWLTKAPFTHESLLLDCKDQRLTKAERREALKRYEQDKRASLGFNYARPSYANYYPSTTASNRACTSMTPTTNRTTNTINLPASRPSYSGMSNSRNPTNNNRPVASVPPYSANNNIRRQPFGHPLIRRNPTPNDAPAATTTANNNNANNNMMTSAQVTSSTPMSGVECHMVIATTDIPIPTANTVTMTSSGQFVREAATTTSSSASGVRDKIRAGEEIMIMTTRKGTYIRTAENKIFTVKANDSSSASQHQQQTHNNVWQQQQQHKHQQYQQMYNSNTSMGMQQPQYLNNTNHTNKQQQEYSFNNNNANQQAEMSSIIPNNQQQYQNSNNAFYGNNNGVEHQQNWTQNNHHNHQQQQQVYQQQPQQQNFYQQQPMQQQQNGQHLMQQQQLYSNSSNNYQPQQANYGQQQNNFQQLQQQQPMFNFTNGQQQQMQQQMGFATTSTQQQQMGFATTSTQQQQKLQLNLQHQQSLEQICQQQKVLLEEFEKQKRQQQQQQE